MKKRLLNQLRKSLPKGYAKTLAERCRCSETQISRIFDKTRSDNFGVIEAAIQLKKEYEYKLEKQEEKVKQAVLT